MVVKSPLKQVKKFGMGKGIDGREASSGVITIK
jgi:hypothetical protein